MNKVGSRFLVGEHLEVKKMEDRIQTNFYWLGLHDDITSCYRSYDVCQKNCAQSLVSRAPLGDMPLIDQHFKKVAIDLVGQLVTRDIDTS